MSRMKEREKETMGCMLGSGDSSIMTISRPLVLLMLNMSCVLSSCMDKPFAAEKQSMFVMHNYIHSSIVYIYT